jgi:hypothetical protein
MTTETLEPWRDPAIIPQALHARAQRAERNFTAVARELLHRTAERDALHAAIERALADLRQGRHAAALDVLARALEPPREAA